MDIYYNYFMVILIPVLVVGGLIFYFYQSKGTEKIARILNAKYTKGTSGITGTVFTIQGEFSKVPYTLSLEYDSDAGLKGILRYLRLTTPINLNSVVLELRKKASLFQLGDNIAPAEEILKTYESMSKEKTDSALSGQSKERKLSLNDKVYFVNSNNSAETEALLCRIKTSIYFRKILLIFQAVQINNNSITFWKPYSFMDIRISKINYMLETLQGFINEINTKS